jgi:hypothetical protein
MPPRPDAGDRWFNSSNQGLFLLAHFAWHWAGHMEGWVRAHVLATRGIFGRVFAADACARDCCRFWSNFSVFSLLLPCAPTAAAFLFQFSSIKRLVLLAFAAL